MGTMPQFTPWFRNVDVPINNKHVDSLVAFFESGVTTRQRRGFGVEIEHLVLDNTTDEAVSFYGEHGVEALLRRVRCSFDPSHEVFTGDHLIGLGNDRLDLSVEPGGQLECSTGVITKPSHVTQIYGEFRRIIQPILDEFNIRLVTYGYQPKTSYRDIAIQPKPRYAAMDQYLHATGTHGIAMMRASASTQVSVDFTSEHNAIETMRLGVALGPILAFLFRNTPYYENHPAQLPLFRQHIWEHTDAMRAGSIPGLFDPTYSWRDYAVEILSTPLMVVDLDHTPEASGLESCQRVCATFHENAAQIYPDRALNSYEINHIISTSRS